MGIMTDSRGLYATSTKIMCLIARKIVDLTNDDMLVQILRTMQQFYSEIDSQKLLGFIPKSSGVDQELLAVLKKSSIYFYVLIRSFGFSTETFQDYLLEDVEFLLYFNGLLKNLKIEINDSKENISQGDQSNSKVESMILKFMRNLKSEISKNQESYTYNVGPLVAQLESVIKILQDKLSIH